MAARHVHERAEAQHAAGFCGTWQDHGAPDFLSAAATGRPSAAGGAPTARCRGRLSGPGSFARLGSFAYHVVRSNQASGSNQDRSATALAGPDALLEWMLSGECCTALGLSLL